MNLNLIIKDMNKEVKRVKDSIINNKSQRMKRDTEKFKELEALCNEIATVKFIKY